ncbi:hypothetical protein BH11VER1_BH11VER1_26330 [soil metagenome]
MMQSTFNVYPCPMKSPLHPHISLVAKEIEPHLNAYECPESQGVWIPLQSYFNWLQKHAATIKPLPADYVPDVIEDDTQEVLFCPESGCILARYKVGRGFDFHVDRSPLTGGVWLNQGEWDALKSMELHDDLHLIFTAHYQQRVRSESFEYNLLKSFQDRIGEEDFPKVAEFRNWLLDHPKKRDIQAFLLDRKL